MADVVGLPREVVLAVDDANLAILSGPEELDGHEVGIADPSESGSHGAVQLGQGFSALGLEDPFEGDVGQVVVEVHGVRSALRTAGVRPLDSPDQNPSRC